MVEDSSFLEDCKFICPTPTLNTTLECIGDTWSYANDIQTKINIDSNLLIKLKQYIPNAVIVGKNQEGSLTKSITVYGDGRVVRENIFHYNDQAIGDDKHEKEKRISSEQLQQIVTVLENANFYAITVGCNGIVKQVLDVTMIEIMVSSGGQVHEIIDNSACHAYHFDKFCDLWDQVNEIIGEFQ